MKKTNAITNRAKRLLLRALALMLTLVLCAGAALAETTPGTETAAALTLEGAKAIALGKAQLEETAVFMMKMEEDKDDGRREFEIEFIAGGKEYEYDIDAETGEVLKEWIADVHGRESEIEAGQYLIMENVKQRVLEHAGITEEQAVITKLEFDFDDGQAEYEMKFTASGKTYEAELNAVSGDILKYEMKPLDGKK